MPTPTKSLKQAIMDEQVTGVNPELVKNQLQIISKLKKPVDQKLIEDFLHGKSGPELTVNTINICQELAVYRMNNSLPIFPYKLKVKKNQIYPFY